MDISPKTQLFAVLGHPIAHSLSPLMHNASFNAIGLDAVYVAFDVPPEKLMGVLPAMAELGFCGINLTVPLKETAFLGLADIDESAQRLGSVNTVKISSGKLTGHSTDGDGFLTSFEEEFGCSVKGAAVFILGCGGAGRAVAIACAYAGAEKLVLANRNRARAEKLSSEIAALGINVKIQVPDEPADWVPACANSDIVVQATSVGIHGDESASLLPAEAFRKGQMVYDLVYMFPETGFMRTASKPGAAVANGLGMLLHQGALSFKIWTGKDADITAMRHALETKVFT